MKVDVVRAPLLFGSVVGGAFILLALLAVIAGSTRWDDHLINAIGIFAAGLVISLIFRLATGAFGRHAKATPQARVINLVLLLAIVGLGVIGLIIAMFINSMGFL